MTDKLEHREHLRTVVKKARGEFQLLLSMAAAAANTNPKSRSVTPV